MTDTVPPAIEALHVRVAYGRHLALDGATFSVPAGAVTALIGPNGSGKSTFLHAVAGLLRPISGSLRVLGQPPGRERHRVAYVLQSAQFNERMPITVWEVVAMGRYAVRGLVSRLRDSDRKAITETLDRLGIAELAERHLGELSAGQRQRVFVAQGLVQQAEVLLLDEPVTGLDVVSAERITEAVACERRAGRTVVLTTHDLQEAGAADHLVLLAGVVVASGLPAEVLTTANLARAYGGRLVRLDDGATLLDDAPHHGHGEGRRRGF